jgi:hypothetical protein
VDPVWTPPSTIRKLKKNGAELLGLVQLSEQKIVQFELDASAYAGGNTIVKPLYPMAVSITA